MVKIARETYARYYGPTKGDKIRLGDTSLIGEIEHDHTTYGDECWTGAGPGDAGRHVLRRPYLRSRRRH